MAHYQLFPIFFLVVALYALARGGAPERWSVLVFLMGGGLTLLVVSPLPVRFRHVEVGIALVDLAMLAAFVVLARYAERVWPQWMTAMQIVAVLSHVPILLAPDVVPNAYIALQGLWSWPMLAVLAIGTHCHRRRLRSRGVDPSWRNSSRR